jgi:hypothetical protein
MVDQVRSLLDELKENVLSPRNFVFVAIKKEKIAFVITTLQMS